MPLIKGSSEKAFESNIKETKVNSKTGKERPMKQRLAIAYRMKRKSRRSGRRG